MHSSLWYVHRLDGLKMLSQHLSPNLSITLLEFPLKQQQCGVVFFCFHTGWQHCMPSVFSVQLNVHDLLECECFLLISTVRKMVFIQSGQFIRKSVMYTNSPFFISSWLSVLLFISFITSSFSFSFYISPISSLLLSLSPFSSILLYAPSLSFLTLQYFQLFISLSCFVSYKLDGSFSRLGQRTCALK